MDNNRNPMQRDWWIVSAAVLGILPFTLITLSIMSFRRGRRDYQTGRYWGVMLALVATVSAALFSRLTSSPFYQPNLEGFLLVGILLGAVCTLFAYLGERKGRKRGLNYESLSSNQGEEEIKPISEKSVVEQVNYRTQSLDQSVHDTEDVTVVIDEPEGEPEGELVSSPTTRCPYCAEKIQSAAVKCRFCNEWLVNKSIRPSG